MTGTSFPPTPQAYHAVEAHVGAVNARIADLPGSKSIANRALICAALGSGTSRLQRVASGDDTRVMIDCLVALGTDVTYHESGASAVIRGLDGKIAPVAGTRLAARLAGTTSRFVTAMAALSSEPVIIDGDPPLRERPMQPLHDALGHLGARIEPADRPGHLPVKVSRSRLAGGTVHMSGDVSSQYLTALMLIAPYLSGGLTIELTTTLVSRPYVELTAAVMAIFGHSDVSVDASTVWIGPGRYSEASYSIEVDASSASYPLGLAAICGGSVVVEGLGRASRQGDAAFAGILERMGAAVEISESATRVTATEALRGIDVDMADISDTMPTLAAIAPFAVTPTRITGVEFIRRKETDRIRAMATELGRCGVRVEELDDGLVIHPCSAPHGALVETYHDHRIAMSMALFGTRVPGVSVIDPSVVSKSWPGFWHSLRYLTTATD